MPTSDWAVKAKIKEREQLGERIERALDLPLAVLALILLGLVVVDLAVPLSPSAYNVVTQAETAIWLVFLAQFLLLFVIAPNKIRYLRTHWLVAISVLLPFLRIFRLFYLLRLIRPTALIRLVTLANRAVHGIQTILGERGFPFVAATIAAIVPLAAAGMFYFERGAPGSQINTYGDAFWWAASTMTTMGSSLQPITGEGRALAIAVMVLALAVFGYVTATIATFFIGREAAAKRKTNVPSNEQEIRRLRRQIRTLSKRLEDKHRR
ncbi:MAG: ion transporter [Chloroflexota bacterium]